MNTKNDPAFPIGDATGLSKLEWFAGMALLVHVNTDNWASVTGLAKLSFDIAEAMVAESEKRSV